MAKRKAAAAVAEPAVEAQEYTVLARRYRPQQFKDLIGQEAVAQALTNALQSNRVAHAYLFTGLRGVGKTSAARILAKSLNCVNGPTTTPCDQCDMCRSITAGEDVDVLEIDGASNRGIDEVREIRQNVQFRPSRSRYKIYIIDEVHMLTPQAFNALLKTLEEPPPHVKFIFATTEAQKIPVTILSRCQRFDFVGVRTDRIVERLRSIVAAENRTAEDQALQLIARRAGGSMRDSQSLLDQLLAFAGEPLSVADVHQLLGTTSSERVAELAAAALQRDSGKALEVLAQILEEGRQVGELLDQLIEYWRDLLIARCSGNAELILSVTGSLRDGLQKQAQGMEPDTILAGLDVLVTAKNRMRATQHTRVLAEMTVVRLGRLENLVALADLSQLLATSSSQPPTSVPAGARVVKPPEEKKNLIPEQRNGTPRSTDSVTPVISNISTADALPLVEQNLQTIWQKLLGVVGPMLASELGKVSRVAIFGPNTLALHFSQGYNQERLRYLDPARVARVEELLSGMVGSKCSIRLEFTAVVAADEAKVETPATQPMPSNEQRRRAQDVVGKHPLIARALDVLGAQVVHMDEDFAKDLEAAP